MKSLLLSGFLLATFSIPVVGSASVDTNGVRLEYVGLRSAFQNSSAVASEYGAQKKKKRPACSDRKDNDRDGLRDYPADPGCSSRRDNRERDPQSTPNDPGLGAISLVGRQLFPPDNPWNQDISSAPVDPRSDAIIASIGANTGLHPDFGTFWEGAPIGIPYTAVRGTQRPVAVSFEYADESDAGPYPIPLNAPIEGGSSATGDRHILVVDIDHWVLYELFSAYPSGAGFRAGSGAVFDLASNALRPPGWTSADAAGLPILPGLVRYDEAVEAQEITHALRFTVSRSRRAYVPPATHFASSRTDENLPPMGMRVRLKSSVNISGYPATVQVILRALKKYGMF
ncbi:MAG: hypothetical protein IT290_04080, partial [Deltaproteobacteria bacterium]|nr:hypothetical protein [Deltaproteobacteria bacterium]